jgi:hypothetical protein
VFTDRRLRVGCDTREIRYGSRHVAPEAAEEVSMSCRPECPTCEGLRQFALEIVGDGGVDALSLEVLSARSGLSCEQVRTHYPTVAACVYDAYDEAAGNLFRVFADAFGDNESWEAAFATATRELFMRVATNPAEARFCFVEALRVDRELRRRCERRRAGIVEYLTGEYEHGPKREPLSSMQIELLVGASFHAISDALASGGQALLELGPKLSLLAGAFQLAAAA